MSFRPVIATSLALTLLAGVSLAQTVPAAELELNLGDKVEGSLASPEDVDLYSFRGVASQLVTIKVQGQGKPSAIPGLTLLNEAMDELDTAAEEKGEGTRTFQLRKYSLPESGVYFMQIHAVGAAGDYLITTQVSNPKGLTSVAGNAAGSPGGGPQIPFDAMPGAKLSGTIRAAQGTSDAPEVGDLMTPSGTLDLSPYMTSSGTKLTLKDVPLDELGRYHVVLGNTSGIFTVKLKVNFAKQKKVTHVEPVSPDTPGFLSGGVAVDGWRVTQEVEPNDDVATSLLLGTVKSSNILRAEGSTTDNGNDPGSFDLSDRDSYRIRIDHDQQLTISLIHEIGPDPGNAPNDFDIALVDPDSGGFITFFQSGGTTERGLINVVGIDGEAFIDVVVYSFEGDGRYVLSVVGNDFPQPAGAGSVAGGDLPVQVKPGQPAPPLAPRAGTPQSILSYNQLGIEFMERQMLVKLDDPTVDAGAWAAARDLELLSETPSGWLLVQIEETDVLLQDSQQRRVRTVATKERLRNRDDVNAAQLNFLYQRTSDPGTGGPVVPDDTHWPLLWHYPQINLAEAWSLTQGSEEVIAAVLDTGIARNLAGEQHPDIVDQDTNLGYDMISFGSIAADGQFNEFDDRDPDPTDPGDGFGPFPNSWHGTHVAGTIAASTCNASGVAGVGWNTKLMHVRVLGKGGGTSYDIAAGIRYAAGLPNSAGVVPDRAADVINMSLGGPGFDLFMSEAVAAARQAGTVVVASAGNGASSIPSYPGALGGVISVGATDYNRDLTYFSNWGASVDLVAPGGDVTVDRNGDGYGDGVLSTWYNDFSDAWSYVFYQGTSQSAPHVAGVCALMKAVNPDLTPDQIEHILEQTAQDIGAPGRDDVYGHGFLDAYAAVEAAMRLDTMPPRLSVSVSSINFSTEQSSRSVMVGNFGGGDLDFDVVKSTGATWLEVTPDAGVAPATMSITVDRQALSQPGTYSAWINVFSNGGSAAIPVSTTVSGGPLDMGEIVVVAVDPHDPTLSTVGEASTTAGGDWSLNDVPPGTYMLVAGPDLDGDENICGFEEPCALYPNQLDPRLVELVPGGSVDGLDITIIDGVNLNELLSSDGEGFAGIPVHR